MPAAGAGTSGAPFARSPHDRFSFSGHAVIFIIANPNHVYNIQSAPFNDFLYNENAEYPEVKLPEISLNRILPFIFYEAKRGRRFVT